MGSPSIFFRILVHDEEAPAARLHELAQRLSVALMNDARTDENGLHAVLQFQERFGTGKAPGSRLGISAAATLPLSPYPRELLDSAIALYQADPETQATLRRAVSTAYYSLFHFLVEETCRNWARPEQRHKLARSFDHKNMYVASNRRVTEHKNTAPGSKQFHLYSVAYALAQPARKVVTTLITTFSKTLSSTDVGLDILLAEEAFSDELDAIQNRADRSGLPLFAAFQGKIMILACKDDLNIAPVDLGRSSNFPSFHFLRCSQEFRKGLAAPRSQSRL